jgi:hypothetical protein
MLSTRHQPESYEQRTDGSSGLAAAGRILIGLSGVFGVVLLLQHSATFI